MNASWLAVYELVNILLILIFLHSTPYWGTGYLFGWWFGFGIMWYSGLVGSLEFAVYSIVLVFVLVTRILRHKTRSLPLLFLTRFGFAEKLQPNRKNALKLHSHLVYRTTSNLCVFRHYVPDFYFDIISGTDRACPCSCNDFSVHVCLG